MEQLVHYDKTANNYKTLRGEKSEKEEKEKEEIYLPRTITI